MTESGGQSRDELTADHAQVLRRLPGDWLSTIPRAGAERRWDGTKPPEIKTHGGDTRSTGGQRSG